MLVALLVEVLLVEAVTGEVEDVSTAGVVLVARNGWSFTERAVIEVNPG